MRASLVHTLFIYFLIKKNTNNCVKIFTKMTLKFEKT